MDIDDVGDTPAEAQDITLNPAGFGSQSGTIEAKGDVDVFRVVAPMTGRLQIRQDADPGSDLDSLLTLLDDKGHWLANNDDSNGTLNSTVQFDVTAGRTYYVQAGAFGSSTGPYTLTFSTDDFGDTVAEAEVITLDATGAGSQSGTIEVAGDVDVFRFVAPTTGWLMIWQGADAGSPLDSLLTLADADGNVLDRCPNNDYWPGRDSLIQHKVVAGQTYFVKVAAFDQAVGRYTLTLSTVADDFGDTPAEAQVITLDAAGFGSQSGTIHRRPHLPRFREYQFGAHGDVDVFRVVAPMTGRLQIRQDADPGSDLDSLLTLLDDKGHWLANNDDSNGTLNSTVQFDVTAGRTYYVQAGAFGSSTGPYTLTFSTGASADDFGDTNAEAEVITLDATGAGRQQGAIEVAGDVDVFRFVAPTTGGLMIRQDADAGSPLDCLLTLADAVGYALDDNDGSVPGRDSLIEHEVVAGRTYFVKVAAFDQAVGRYTLTLRTVADDFGDTLAEAQELTLDPTGAGRQQGTIEADGDVDVFRFVAPVTGSLVIRQDADAGSALDSFLTLLDADGNKLAQDENSGPGLNSLVQFDVVAGQTYFVQAAGEGWYYSFTRAGRYSLTLFTLPEPGNGFATAQDITRDFTRDITSSPLGVFYQLGSIADAQDVDIFRFVAPTTGRLTIRQELPNTVGLTVLDSSRQPIVDNSSGLDIPVRFDVVAGQTYFVRAAAANASTSRYILSFVLGDVGDTPAEAQTLLLDAAGSGHRQDTIEVVGDVDVFRFVAPTTGRVTIWLDAFPDSTLDSFLTLLDADGNKLAYGYGPGLNSQLQFDVIAGRAYFVEADGLGTGRYTLNLSYGPHVVDDIGDTFQDARTIISGLPAHYGIDGHEVCYIDVAGDVDVFRFVAPTTDRVTIRGVTFGSNLVGTLLLTAFDAEGVELTQALNDVDLQLKGVATQTYYVRVEGSSIGVYNLLITTDRIIYSIIVRPAHISKDPRDLIVDPPFIGGGASQSHHYINVLYENLHMNTSFLIIGPASNGTNLTIPPTGSRIVLTSFVIGLDQSFNGARPPVQAVPSSLRPDRYSVSDKGGPDVEGRLARLRAWIAGLKATLRAFGRKYLQSPDLGWLHQVNGWLNRFFWFIHQDAGESGGSAPRLHSLESPTLHRLFRVTSRPGYLAELISLLCATVAPHPCWKSGPISRDRRYSPCKFHR